MIDTKIIHLTGNPIRVKSNVSNIDTIVWYRVYINDIDNLAYKGSFQLKKGESADVEISDILRNYVKSRPLSGDDYLIPAPNFMTKFFVDMTTNPFSPFNYAVYGGIPKYLHRRLSESGTNIFEYKYLNRKSNNYALTTRTAGKQIVIRETEVCPLMIMYKGEDLKFVSHSGKLIHIPATRQEDYSFVGINLEKILYDFFIQKNELTRYINVLTNDEYSFSVAFPATVPSEEKYILEFRNSLGAYERIELSGRASSVPEFEEENLYNVYDATANDFVGHRKRTLSTATVKCECGYKTREELDFLRDLISSDDIRILGPDNAWAKVHVTVDEYEVPVKMTEPESIPLIIRFSEKEEYYLPNIFVPDSAGDTEAGTGWLGKGFWNANGFLLSNSPWISQPKNN
ncbi:MAG: hypothetical protein FWF54_01620 [Candidatus Azobacteroides sp.]|nr:hypothetical protein [Candidatus Azobacteroides sp.]